MVGYYVLRLSKGGTTANNLVFLAACLWGYLLADADRYGISALMTATATATARSDR